MGVSLDQWPGQIANPEPQIKCMVLHMSTVGLVTSGMCPARSTTFEVAQRIMRQVHSRMCVLEMVRSMIVNRVTELLVEMIREWVHSRPEQPGVHLAGDWPVVGFGADGRVVRRTLIAFGEWLSGVIYRPLPGPPVRIAAGGGGRWVAE